jgi:hypothetical protein
VVCILADGDFLGDLLTAGLQLTARWQLLGALEALNGMLLFGLTTAFLYGVLQRVWPSEAQGTLS